MKNVLDQHLISLREEDHKYTVKPYPHLSFTSVTTFIKEFFDKFNAEGIASNLANNNPKYANETKESILKSWNKIGEIGTAVHLEIENWIIARQKGLPLPEPTYEKAKHGIDWLKENIEDHHILYPEVRLYSERLQLAGTVDLLIYDPNSDLWIMADWKTNKTITTTAYKGKKGIHAATKHLEDCKLTVYALQMSFYQWLLEKEYGIKVHNRVLLHLRPKPTRVFPLGVKEFWTPYLKANVERMADHRMQMKEEGRLFENVLLDLQPQD